MTRAMFIPVAHVLLFAVPNLGAQDFAPLPEHKILAQQEGVWDAEMSMFTPGQDPKEAAKSKGVETNRLLAGKWLISDIKGDFFGSAFEGHGVNGYDAKKAKYIGTWVDSMSQHIDQMEGTYDEKTKTLTLNADSVNPASGQSMKMRLETQFKDDDTRVFSEYVKMHGEKEFNKLMEIKYTKRKK
jgi:hypothetical protein